MFTGLIQAVGRVVCMEPENGDMRFCFDTGSLQVDDVSLGDSIAISGVCLTITDLQGDNFWADVSRETLSLTTLGSLSRGDFVNLEKSVTPTAYLGGHIVSGHVDGVGEVLSITKDARSWRYSLRAPTNIARYIAKKGSICVDGTSLTINAVADFNFEVNIIPSTWNATVFQHYIVGTQVNLEVDLIARYLERLIESRESKAPIEQNFDQSIMNKKPLGE